MEGETLGSYRVLSELGRGGMGAVYLAEHALIGKRAAVKILLPQFSRDNEIVTRFFNEARAATQIRHPGIVEIFDFGYHTNGCAFLVMEFLDGESLASRLRREGGRLAEPWLVEVTRQIASALQAAHAKGIVHRDLKPDNVYLVPDADLPLGVRVKLLDFGIAKLSGDGETSLKTRTGAVMGTPMYMSPEQCRGAGRVDFRSDIYSLGCVMFELATGRVPFVGEGMGDIIGAHIFSPAPRASSLQPTISPGIDALIARMMEKDPASRPQSMAEVLSSLEALGLVRPSGRNAIVPQVADAATFVPPPTTTLGGAASEVVSPPAPRPVRWVAPTALIVIAVLGIAGWRLLRHAPEPSTAPPEVAAPIAAAPVEAPAAPPAAAPALVHLTIDSTPSGADVLHASDGARLGTTPLEQVLPKSTGSAEYLLKLHGYRDASVTVPLDHDVNKVVAMERAHGASTSKPRTKDAKPIKNGVMDPFAN